MYKHLFCEGREKMILYLARRRTVKRASPSQFKREVFNHIFQVGVLAPPAIHAALASASPSATSQSAARKRVANQAKNCKLPEQIANSATKLVTLTP